MRLHRRLVQAARLPAAWLHLCSAWLCRKWTSLLCGVAVVRNPQDKAGTVPLGRVVRESAKHGPLRWQARTAASSGTTQQLQCPRHAWMCLPVLSGWKSLILDCIFHPNHPAPLDVKWTQEINRKLQHDLLKEIHWIWIPHTTPPRLLRSLICTDCIPFGLCLPYWICHGFVRRWRVQLQWPGVVYQERPTTTGLHLRACCQQEGHPLWCPVPSEPSSQPAGLGCFPFTLFAGGRLVDVVISPGFSGWMWFIWWCFCVDWILVDYLCVWNLCVSDLPLQSLFLILDGWILWLGQCSVGLQFSTGKGDVWLAGTSATIIESGK